MSQAIDDLVHEHEAILSALQILERLLAAGQWAAIFERFEAHEAQVIGQGRHEHLHALLKGLRAKYVTLA